MTRGNAPEDRPHAPLGKREPTDRMVVLLLINLATSIVMLALSWYRATGEYCAARFYPATIPIMAQAGLAALVALAGLVSGRERFTCLIASGAALGLLGLPWLYAGLQWPGGDDGGSLGWLFIVGGGCATSFVIALVTTIMGVMARSPRRRGPILPEPLPDVPALIVASKDPNFLVRVAAAEALAKIGLDAKETVSALIAALKDSDGHVRMNAAKALGKMAPDAKTAIPALKEALKDESKRVRQAAAEALNKIQPAPATRKAVE